jgi:hypothetical protein
VERMFYLVAKDSVFGKEGLSGFLGNISCCRPCRIYNAMMYAAMVRSPNAF